MSTQDRTRQIAALAANELTRRRQDGLSMMRIVDTHVSPGAPDQVAAFQSQSSEMLLRGGNRSSKSVTAAALVASIARDVPVMTYDGRLIETRRKHQKGRELQIWVIGLKIDHFATIHRLLFRAGVYKIIKDKDTQEWRAWRPWEQSDAEREDECKPSFPLIPRSMVDPKSWSWESKASRQMTHVRLPGLAEIWCFPSTAQEPRQGEPVDVIWIDEAIQYPAHYGEWQARLSDERGRIIWSSWPRKGNEALTALSERAQQQATEVADGDRDKADVEEYVFTFSGNPFIPADEKRKRLEGWSEEEAAARDRGEFAVGQFRIYPFFDETVHRAIPKSHELDDEIAKILRANGGVPPDDWTHEMIVDPGTAKPAALMCATPPPELWGGPNSVHIAYQEVYRKRMTAREMAAEVFRLKKMENHFYRWIIDNQAARRQPEGFEQTIGQLYSEAFGEAGLSNTMFGTAFVPGNPDFQIRRQMMEELLAIDKTTGRPRLRIVVENCPSLVKQLTTNELQVVKDQVTDREMRQADDVRYCCEYWVSCSPQWVPASEVRPRVKTSYELYKEWVAETFGSSKTGGDRVRIGPSTGA